jgi:hypothetical protein
LSKIFIISAFIVVSLISSLILITLIPPLRELLYFFEISLIGILLLVIFKGNIEIRIPVRISVNTVDYFFIISALLVLLLNIVNISSTTIEIVRFCFSVMVSFFLPGWVFIRLLDVYDKIKKLPILVLCFSISIGLSSLIYTFKLFRNNEMSTLILLLIYLSISLFPLLKHGNKKLNKNKIHLKTQSKSFNLVEIITITWISFFFIFTILILYPQFAYVPGNDIIRHYSTILGLKDLSESFHSEYPWFHFSLASLNEISKSEIWLFQSGIPFLSIMMIFSFYIMSKAYIFSINRNAHLLATSIFTTFSGLGWIYFIQNLPSFSHNDQFHLLSLSFFGTYYDIGIGQSTWLWLWFRPITVGFTIFFLLLYIMRIETIGRITYIIISSMLMLILSLTHFSEFSIFVMMLFIISIFLPKLRIRFKETILSIIISLISYSLISTVYLNILGSNSVSFHKEYVILLVILSSLTLLLLKYSRRLKFSIKINDKRIISFMLLIYGIIIAYWIANSNTVARAINDIISSPMDILAVPVTIYPILLGITGIFAIPAIIIILKDYRSNPIIIFPIILLSIIIIGKIISFININFDNLGYWERRLIPYLTMSASIIATITIYKIINYITLKIAPPKKLNFLKNLTIVTMVSFLVLLGTLSTYLSLEYQTLQTSQNIFTNNEKQLQNNNLFTNSHSTLLTVSSRSSSVAEYANLNYIIGYYKFQIWPSKSPELPLNILNGLNNSANIYVSKGDLNQIKKSGYEDGYISSHLMQVAPKISIDNDQNKILQIPKLSPPTSKSEMVLVLPDNTVKAHYYYAYDILSQGKYNYTTAKLSDISTIKKAKIIVVPNEEIASIITNYKNIYNLQFKSIIIFNLDGYGKIANVYGTSLKNSSESSYSIASNNGNKEFNKFNSIVSKNSIQSNLNNNTIILPSILNINPIIHDPAYIVRAHYNNGIPFVLEKSNDAYNIYYVNVFPIIKNINSDYSNSESMYSVLGKSLNMINMTFPSYKFIDKPSSQLVSGGISAFSKAILKGNISINSPSSLIFSDKSPISININNSKYVINNLRNIIPIDVNDVQIKSNNAIFNGGSGFYTNLTLQEPSTINFIGKPAIISLLLDNNHKIDVKGKNIQININKINILSRQPKIVLNGITNFSQFYAYGDLNSKIRVLGKNLVTDGKVNLNIIYSDKFMISNGTSLNGKIISPQSTYYQNVESISIFKLSDITYITVMVLIFIIYNIYITNRKQVVLNKR